MQSRDMAVVLGIVGACLLLFGTFAPLFSVAILGSISLFDTKDSLPGVFMLVAGISALFSAVRRDFAALWLTVGAGASVLVWMWFVARDVQQPGVLRAGVGWGAGILLTGLVLITASALMRQPEPEVVEREKRYKTLAAVLVCVSILGNLAARLVAAGAEERAEGPPAQAVEVDPVADQREQLEKAQASARTKAEEERRKRLELELNLAGNKAIATLAREDREKEPVPKPPPRRLTEEEKAEKQRRAAVGAQSLAASGVAFGAKPTPRKAASQLPREQVAAWHDEYTSTIAPLKGALAAYRSATASDGNLATACRELRDVAISLAKLEAVTAAPVGARDLRTSIGRFKDAGMACLVGKATHQRLMMNEGEQALGRFAQALAAYGLAP